MRKLILLITSFCLFFLMQQFSFATPLPTEPTPLLTNNWYDDIFFTDKFFSYQFIRTLGYSYSGGADLGECVNTAKIIPDADIDAWFQQWLALANRINSFGDTMQKRNDIASAREAYLRSANYFRTAAFFKVGEGDHELSANLLAQSQLSFLNAIQSMSFIQPVKIPYENIALPGYLLRSPFKNAPLLIVTTGFDGTAEELYFKLGIAAYQRGYNVLLFEGPGQGNVLRKVNLPFRYDWEHVITPVIDYAVNIPDINKNKIALMGISMGGYLAARAAAFDKRIKACVLNGGVYNIYEAALKRLPYDTIKLLKSNPERFNKVIYDEMKVNPTTYWYFSNGMWSFAAESPSAFIEKLAPYSLEEVIDKIKVPVLVVDSSDDLFYRGQAKQLFDALKSPKTYLLFTPEDNAQAHCQMGADTYSNERIFHWLNETLT